MARPRRPEAKLADFDVIVDARKARIPNDTANPITTGPLLAAEDVSSENAFFLKSKGFTRDVLPQNDLHTKQQHSTTTTITITSTPSESFHPACRHTRGYFPHFVGGGVLANSLFRSLPIPDFPPSYARTPHMHGAPGFGGHFYEMY